MKHDNLIVFHGHGDHILAPFLKTGFTHVFCCINDGVYWIVLDSRGGVPEIDILALADYDLQKFYEDSGFTVLRIKRGKPTGSLIVLSNCVGFVKSILGIHCFAVTPWQLYKRLK